MKYETMLLLTCWAVASQVQAQDPASSPPASTATAAAAQSTSPPATTQPPADNPSGSSPGTVETPVDNPSDSGSIAPSATGDVQGAREIPLDNQPFHARVSRTIEDYGGRHQQREQEMASYAKAGGDPSLERFADPKMVQVEIADEADREQTSEELAGDYRDQAHAVFSKRRAVEEFIAKRHQKLDSLTRQNGAGVSRQELELALTNLARQPESPETLVAMRDIDRRLSELEHSDKLLPAQVAQAQQEMTDAAAELEKLQQLQKAYEGQAQVYSAEALSAHQNRLRLADRLEYDLVRSQVEDTLEEGRQATESVERLPLSPEVQNTLSGSAPAARSDADLGQLRDCLRQTGDVKACRGKLPQE
jgi:hypothetical protein